MIFDTNRGQLIEQIVSKLLFLKKRLLSSRFFELILALFFITEK